MGYTCCVPGCRTGYRSSKRKGRLFQFPSDPTLRNKWIAAIPRLNWTVSYNHRVCEKHFSPNDFVLFSIDSRKRKLGSPSLLRTRLKSHAVPHLFPNPETLCVAHTAQPLTSCTKHRKIPKFFKELNYLAREIKDFDGLSSKLYLLNLNNS